MISALPSKARSHHAPKSLTRRGLESKAGCPLGDSVNMLKAGEGNVEGKALRSLGLGVLELKEGLFPGSVTLNALLDICKDTHEGIERGQDLLGYIF